MKKRRLRKNEFLENYKIRLIIDSPNTGFQIVLILGRISYAVKSSEFQHYFTQISQLKIFNLTLYLFT